MYPPSNTGAANVPASIQLSGAGITKIGTAEYAVRLSVSDTPSVEVSATVVDISGATVSPQPSLAVTSSNGAQQAGGSSETSNYPQSNGAGSQEELTPGNPSYGPNFHEQAYVAGEYPSSLVATVEDNIVTAQNLGGSLIEWRTASGATGRLTVQVVQ
jgi:hypothetical protein